MIYRYYRRFDTRKNWARDIYAQPLVELINFKYCKRDISSLTKCVITELQFICFAARWNTRISRPSTFVSNFEPKFIQLATNFLGFLFFYSKYIRNTFENKTHWRIGFYFSSHIESGNYSRKIILQSFIRVVYPDWIGVDR